jgi:hypothetical protein
MSKLPLLPPIEEPFIENPELAVPAIVGYKAYESYQGIQAIRDRFRNESTPVTTVPSSSELGQDSRSGSYIFAPPRYNNSSSNSYGGTGVTAPPNSTYGTFIASGAPRRENRTMAEIIAESKAENDRLENERKAITQRIQDMLGITSNTTDLPGDSNPLGVGEIDLPTSADDVDLLTDDTPLNTVRHLKDPPIRNVYVVSTEAEGECR